MKILILSTAFSGMAQRVLTELIALNHEVEEHYDLDPDFLIEQVETFQPRVIICPFLTQRIPQEVWQNYLCLIVHPGIEGDRGPSSLDWAITEGAGQWGVTLLQADADYDAGDIWGTQNFPMREASKLSIYKREVTQAAISLIKQALIDVESGSFSPRPLDYNRPGVVGRDRAMMAQSDRLIEWQSITSMDAHRKLNAADTRPGVRGIVAGVELNMFGAIVEPDLRGEPGQILALYKNYFCCATADGAVWIKQLKCSGIKGLPAIKLPAVDVLEKICSEDQFARIPRLKGSPVADDIHVEWQDDTAFLHFNFYNGAMNTEQCIDLRKQLIKLKLSHAKIIVLMGGENFWSNGIHLNCIEAADDPAEESWQNINAIDDLVYEIIDSPDQLIVSALRNNAGAGGVILALACDEVIIRDGVVLNPHYKTMGLYGSEYWTYLLPKRVGREKALALTEQCRPLLASDAISIGLADVVLAEDWESFHQGLREHCDHLREAINFDEYLSVKIKNLASDNAIKPLHKYRDEELTLMHKTFFDPMSEYHRLRRNFVYKVKCVQQRRLTLTQESQVM